MMENSKDLFSLLQSVVQHWQQSTNAYADYLENGKTFRYAQELKKHNTAVANLLTTNKSVIPVDLQSDVEAIIEHYTIWTAKWNEHAGRLNPGPDDEFVFENEHRFPREAARRVEAVFSVLATHNNIK